VLFVTELLQSLGNRHANERKPRRNPSRQSKTDLPSRTTSAWQALRSGFVWECGDMSPLSKRGHVRALQTNETGSSRIFGEGAQSELAAGRVRPTGGLDWHYVPGIRRQK
jgi:hypothetical protein